MFCLVLFFSAGYRIDARAMPELRKETDDRNQPTRDVHVHNASASPDAIGGVAHVRAGQVVGYRPLEEQGVVLDFHISGQGAIQAMVREGGENTDAMNGGELQQATTKINK